jgi:hypothetical protein
MINSIKDINTHCLAEFRKHWECLDNRNHQLWQCRPAEWKLNKCVYDNLVRQPWPITLYEGSNTIYRNSRRRSPISQRTRPLFTFDQSRSSLMCASGLETASPSFRGRRMRNNRALESIKIEVRSCTFVDESKRNYQLSNQNPFAHLQYYTSSTTELQVLYPVRYSLIYSIHQAKQHIDLR